MIPVSGQILRFSYSQEATQVFVKGTNSLFFIKDLRFLGSTSIKSQELSSDQLSEGRLILGQALKDSFGLDVSKDTEDVWGTRVRAKDRMPFWGQHPDEKWKRKLYLLLVGFSKWSAVCRLLVESGRSGLVF